MLADVDLFRAAMEYIGTVSPIQDILRRPDVAAAIERVGDGPPMSAPGPSRQALLDLVR